MSSREETGNRLAALSPERRALVEKLLRADEKPAPAAGVPNARNVHAGMGARTIPRRASADPARLSFAQQRLWFLDQLAPGNPLYNMPLATRLSFPLVPAALEEAINDIVQRHEVLRTTFTLRDGEPVQIVRGTLRVPLPVVDLRHLPASEREREATRLATVESQTSFDLEQGPLIRARLVQLGDADHLFLMTMHHIVGDAWSLMVFSREISALYPARQRGQPPPLPALPIQYADFAEWQRQTLQGDVLDQQLAYWKTQLADLPTLQLPTDRPRPPIQGFRGAYRPWTLDRSVATGIRALGRTAGTTPFMTLLAAFAALLHRYTGQTDIVVGTPVANRTRWEIEPLIGFFVNSLVLRTDVGGDPTFDELLRRIQKVSLDAFAHQDAPFEMLVETLQPARDASRNPLFQVTFQLFTPPGGKQPLGDEASMPIIHRGTAMFDIALSLMDNGTTFAGGFEYDTDLFDHDSIAQMGDALTRLVDAAVRDPRSRVSALPLLSEAERQQLLVTWNATSARYDGPPYLDRLFAAQAVRTPQAIAVSSESAELTYADLDRAARRLAARLRGLGVGPDRLVGICLERSAEMVIALMAVLEAGGAYVPLDPAYPRERLHFMLADAAAHVLITQRSLAGLFPEAGGVPVLWLDDDDGRDDREERDDRLAAEQNQRRTRDAAYVIYTSGSTGRPKGVVIAHAAICNHMQWMQDRFPIGPEDRVLQRTPFSFDASVWEFHLPLMAGARLVLAGPRTQSDPGALVRTLRDERITILQVVPSLLDVLLDEPEFDRSLALRRVFCGGEALPARIVRRFHERLDAELCNLYGPTEAAIDATYWVSPGHLSSAFAPIGRPIANTEIYVLDAARQPVPVGVTGEIYIGGPGLAREYLHRPEVTGERFVPHPFSGGPDARVYRTGDAGRYLRDGAIEFLGRLDHQVKLRGYRIELGEIEAALREHASVRDVVAICQSDSWRDQRLIAYVVRNGTNGHAAAGASDIAHAGSMTSADASSTNGADAARTDDDLASVLRAHLQQRLPAYMLPDTFALLEELPRLPNGKTDRAALPRADRAASTHRPPYVAPRNEIEETLAGVWAEVLRVPRVGVHDNFFADLGGHSLLGTQLIARVRRTFQIELPLYRLFESPTIAELAPRVADACADPSRRAGDSIPRLTDAPHAPPGIRMEEGA